MVFALWLLVPAIAVALDLFTLWRRPELPLQLPDGGWADYRRLDLAGGQRTTEIFRVQCFVADPEGRGAEPIVLEILPLRELADGSLEAIPGEGLRLIVDPSLRRRDGDLLEAVREVERWEGGHPEVLPPAQWRDDPLVADSFAGEFAPDTVETQGQTTRVIGGRELVCDQFLFAAADSQAIELPHGLLEQLTTQEVTAAVSLEIPFLGLAYAAERLRAESRLTPPSDRFRAPAPQVRVETLECLDHGLEAPTRLRTADER